MKIDGVDSNLLPKTFAAIEDGIKDGTTPGVVFGYFQKKNPNQFFLGAKGNRRLFIESDSTSLDLKSEFESNANSSTSAASTSVPSTSNQCPGFPALAESRLPMQPDTIFDYASVTKIFVTATLTAKLRDLKLLDYTDSLQKFFPEFKHHETVRLEHLLSHSAGFTWWQPFWKSIIDEVTTGPNARQNATLESTPRSERERIMRKMILDTRPEEPVGSKMVYSDVSILWMGYVLEAVTGLPLDQAVKKYVWDEMGLQVSKDKVGYRVVDQPASTFHDERVAATEFCPWRKAVLQGVVDDDNTYAMGGIAPHAGVFGRAQDLLQFAKCLMSGFLKDETMRLMTTRFTDPVGTSRTRGWDTPSGLTPSAGQYFSKNSFGHLGFTGTSLWIDPDAEIAVVLLTNRLHPQSISEKAGDGRGNKKILGFRGRFHDALMEDLR